MDDDTRLGSGRESGLESGLESALERTEADVAAATRAAAALTAELKRARLAAAAGQLRDLRKALAAAALRAGELAEQVTRARDGYDVNEVELLSTAAYRKELLGRAASTGLSMFEEDERLLCYPSLVRVLPAELALEIDRRRDRRLRPSVVVATLRAAQEAGPRFKAEPFLRSLRAGYELVVAQQGKSPGAVVPLTAVYDVLTLLPGQARDYGKQEFARDLYLLDQSGVLTDKGSGRQLRWAASSGTRSTGVLTTVASSGQQQRYWGVAFTGAPGS